VPPTGPSSIRLGECLDCMGCQEAGSQDEPASFAFSEALIVRRARKAAQVENSKPLIKPSRDGESLNDCNT